MSNHKVISPPWDRSDTALRPPSRIYTPQAQFEDRGGEEYYPPSRTQTPTSQCSVIRRDESRTSSLPVVISLPLAVCATLVLSVPTYVESSLGTNTWGTRAIEYAIGTGCVGTAASLLLLVEKHCYADTLLEWKLRTADRDGVPGKVELWFLLAYAAALFSSAPGLGYAIRSLNSEVSTEGIAALVQAFWGVVPAVLAVKVAIRWMGPRIGVIVSEV